MPTILFARIAADGKSIEEQKPPGSIVVVKLGPGEYDISIRGNLFGGTTPAVVAGTIDNGNWVVSVTNLLQNFFSVRIVNMDNHKEDRRFNFIAIG